MTAFFGVGGNPFTTPVGQRIGNYLFGSYQLPFKEVATYWWH